MARGGGVSGRSAVEGVVPSAELADDEVLLLAMLGLGAATLLLCCCGVCVCFYKSRAACGGSSRSGPESDKSGCLRGRACGDADEAQGIIDASDEHDKHEAEDQLRQPREHGACSPGGGRKAKRGGGRGSKSSNYYGV